MRNLLIFLIIIFVQTKDCTISYADAGNEWAEIYENDCGNKYKNLEKLDTLLQNSGLEGVRVPSFRCLSSTSINAYLRNAAPEIDDIWKSLAQKYVTYTADDMTQFLNLDEVESLLKRIQILAAKAMSEAAQDPKSLNALCIHDDLISWINEIGGQHGYLMVRSSGDEDSKVLANAGGNISEHYVNPQIGTVLDAAGKVVASYFGKASLKNRILQGQNPFTHPLKLAVLLQELVGETIGGAKEPSEIPIGVVLFTNEPTYVDAPSFRVMRITATWGHGEAVVENKGIPTDTILMVPSRRDTEKPTVYYDRHDKIQRLVPQRSAEGIVELKAVYNLQPIRKATLFKPDMLQRLYDLGILAENYFGQATDMELVVKGDVIYVVQARPIIRPKANPTYFDLSGLSPSAEGPLVEQLDVKVLVNGTSNATVIDSSDQVLIRSTLEAAQKDYSKGRHRLVIVWQDEPANSHAVVNFSGMGVPCLYIQQRNQFQRILKRLSKGSMQLAIDLQTGQVSLWNPAAGEDIHTRIVQGWAEHPAALAISLENLNLTALSQLNQARPFDHELRAIFRNLKMGEDPQGALVQLRAHPLFSNLAEQRAGLVNRMEHVSDTSWTARDSIATFDAWTTAATESLDNAETVFDNPESSRLERLFSVKVLQTLLLKTEFEKGALGQVSPATLESLWNISSLAVDYLTELGLPGSFEELSLMGLEAPLKGTQTVWYNFILALDKAATSGQLTSHQNASLNRFVTMTESLQQAGALPLWLTFLFKANPTQPWQSLDELVGQYDTETENALQAIFGSIGEIDSVAQMQPLFADPASFEGAWQKLHALSLRFRNTNTPESVLSHMHTKTPLVRAIGTIAMKRFVDLFDNSIKTLKRGTLWDESQHVHTFKVMLEEYFAVLEAWATLPDKEVVGSEYLSTIQNMLNAKPLNSAQMLPSEEFSVRGAMIGSPVSWGRNLPKTLEDLFTLVHQNLLAIVSIIANELPMDPDIPLPGILTKARNAVQNFKGIIKKPGYGDTPFGFILIGKDVSEQGITFYYQVPLQSHGSTVQLRYDRLTNKTYIDIQFVGYVGEERWRTIQWWAEVVGKSGLILLAPAQSLPNDMTAFTWELGTETNIQDALDVYSQMCCYSVEEDWGGSSEPFERLSVLLHQAIHKETARGVDPLQTLVWIAGGVDEELHTLSLTPIVQAMVSEGREQELWGLVIELSQADENLESITFLNLSIALVNLDVPYPEADEPLIASHIEKALVKNSTEWLAKSLLDALMRRSDHWAEIAVGFVQNMKAQRCHLSYSQIDLIEQLVRNGLARNSARAIYDSCKNRDDLSEADVHMLSRIQESLKAAIPDNSSRKL